MWVFAHLSRLFLIHRIFVSENCQCGYCQMELLDLQMALLLYTSS